jgi:DNA-binding NarL/FixJ family response regulator
MIRVLIAHSSRLVCDSLRSALDQKDELYVVGSVTTSDELLFLLPHSDVVILGTELDNGHTLESIRDIRVTYPQTKVVVMGVNENANVIISYVEAGASGYVLQNESVNDMVAKLEAVHNEEALVSASIAAAMIQRLTELANLELPAAFINARKTQLNELTGREHEVLTLISEGLTNQQIADRLVIEYGTVKNHVHNILSKLDVRNRHEAASLLEVRERSLAAALA